MKDTIMSNLYIVVIVMSMVLAANCTDAVRAKEKVLLNDLFELRGAIDKYYGDNRRCPPTLDALAAEGYVKAIPVDPFTGSASTWRVTFGGSDPFCPSPERGVAEVHSGSDLRSSWTRTMYSEW